MPRYKLIVFTRPNEGAEKEYNRWYQENHLPDVVAVPGVVSAQRFKFHEYTVGPQLAYPYVTIYDVETDDYDAVQAEIRRRGAEGEMVRTDALSTDMYAVTYEECGEVVKK